MAVQSYSVQFNGTTQYLSTPRILDSSGDITIEAWIYVTATPSANGAFILGQYVGAGADRTIFNVDNTLKVGFQAGAVSMGSTTTLVTSRWYHVAVTRIGSGANNMALYVNGTKEGQMTYTGTFQNTNTTIGYTPNLINTWFTGNISNFRIVKGTAVYTSNFSVPISPLTAIANTALLTCNSPTIVDNSGNNVTITLNGSPVVSTFAPFFVTGIALRNTVPQSFSATFNGTSDYLTIPDNSVFNFGASNFTIECWINLSNYTSAQSIFTKRAVATTSVTEIQLYVFSGGLTLYASSDGSTFFINGVGTSAGSFTSNAWNHIALVRNGTEFAGYINGTKSVFGTSAATLMTNTANVAISSDQASSFRNGVAGSISNYRIVNGTALYTSNFTPPTLPLTPIANTALLTLNNSTIKDGSANNFAVTQSGAPVVSGLSTPFGPNFPSRLNFRKVNPSSYSVSFNGSSALSLTGKSLSGANFTIEGWIYFNTFTTNDSPHMFNFGADQNNRYLVWRNSGTGKFNLGAVNTGTYTLTDGATTPVTGSWYHLALVRNGASNYLYVNGVQDATNSAGISSGTSWSIGKNQFDPQVGTHLNGYISNFRVVTGSAVYTSNFNPPGAPLTVVSNTALLTCNESTIRDSSANNYTITVSGSAAINTTIPSSIDNVPKLKIYSVT